MRVPIRRAVVAGSLGVLAVCLAVVSGCSDDDPVSPTSNLAPDTALSVTYEVTTGRGRRVLLEWLGQDEDGSIDHYLVRLDTLDWEEVTGTDTVFVFDERSENPRPPEEEDLHSFSAKAVDNLGKEDPTPAEVSFWSRNQVPETVLTDWPPDMAGAMVTFEWEGTDLDGAIAVYDYRLFYRQPGGEWVQVVPDPMWESITVGPDETSVFFGPLAGFHKFEVWATDNEDAADLTPAECVFYCNPSLGAPELTVTTNVLGTHVFKGPVWPSEYNTPVEISQQHLTFEWAADASEYGGRVTGYRHAYDDTLSWSPWSLNDTSFEVTPELGEHSLYIHALDNGNWITRGRIFIDVVERGPATL